MFSFSNHSIFSSSTFDHTASSDDMKMNIVGNGNVQVATSDLGFKAKRNSTIEEKLRKKTQHIGQRHSKLAARLTRKLTEERNAGGF